MKNYSPLQKEILFLYRKALKLSYSKGKYSIDFINFSKKEFKKNQNISKYKIEEVLN
jgi:hypothetical protein